MGRCDGKVAFVSGAARGQGRSHAVTLAREGADVIAFDLAGPVASVEHYGPATMEDLEETARLVEAEGRRVVYRQADVRDRAAVEAVVADGLAELGQIDIVLGNAGITTVGRAWEITQESWQEMIDINLTGVWNTVTAALPSMMEAGRGGSIVLTGSIAGTMGLPGLPHYVAAKHGVIGLMKALANELADYDIRVNAVNPTNVGTDMILNDGTFRYFRPDLENPTQEDAKEGFMSFNLLKVPWVEPEDVSNAILFLVSEEGRYTTGVALPVDCGTTVKFPN
ncbi:MAG: mycofactocin-coupled SDR family oxidoreductase [Solirubrobacterales bacterium]